MPNLRERNRKRRKVFVKTPSNRTVIRHLAKKHKKKACTVTGQELHGIPRMGPTEAKNSPKTAKRPERPYGGVLSSEAARKKIKANARAQDTGKPESGKLVRPGRLCVKLAGRDAGLKCVIVDVHDNGYVTIDGQTRRRKVSIDHLEPLGETLKLKKGASHSEVRKAFEKANIEVRDTTKPKKKKSKPKKAKKTAKKKTKGKGKDATGDEGASGKKEKEKPSESEIRSMTKDDMKDYAKKEFDIELDTNNLKDEMVENFLEQLEK